MKGILFCGHGSKSIDAYTEFCTLIDRFKIQDPNVPIAFGFLEFSKPSFEEAIVDLYNQGVRHIEAIQLFLFSGKHVETDIPQQLLQGIKPLNDLKIHIHQPLGNNKKLLEILIHSVLPFKKTNKKQALLTVGVGASVQEANRQITELSEQLSQAVEINNLHISFMSRLAKPNFEDSIQNLVKTDIDEIIVVPFILFNGVYYSSILNLSNELQSQYNTLIHVLPTLAANDGFLETVSFNDTN